MLEYFGFDLRGLPDGLVQGLSLENPIPVRREEDPGLQLFKLITICSAHVQCRLGQGKLSQGRLSKGLLVASGASTRALALVTRLQTVRYQG